MDTWPPERRLILKSMAEAAFRCCLVAGLLSIGHCVQPAQIARQMVDLGPGGCVSTTLRTCSGHGRCSAGLCYCDRGYSGSACERREYLSACPSNCSAATGGGRCVRDRCVCATGRSGDDCADVSNVNCSFVCLGHGVCVDGNCRCRPGFYGHACAQGCKGYVVETGAICSGRGLCVPTGSPGHSPDRCDCFVGSSGEGCERQAGDACPRACSGHGSCGDDGKCTCRAGYVGSDCSIELRREGSYDLDSFAARVAAAAICFVLSGMVAGLAMRYINAVRSSAGERAAMAGKPMDMFAS